MTVLAEMHAWGMSERLAAIVAVWVVMLALHKASRWIYAIRTQGWIPLSSDTAWMLAAGYRCELPPSAIGPVMLAIMLTAGMVVV
jgi:hypothetical protein